MLAELEVGIFTLEKIEFVNLNMKVDENIKKITPMIIEIVHLSKFVTLIALLSHSLSTTKTFGSQFIFLSNKKMSYFSECKGEFWLEKPRCLLSNWSIWPDKYSTFEEQMNTLTRLAIVISIVLLLIGKKKAAWNFLIAWIIIIALLYYFGRDKPSQKDEIVNDHDKIKVSTENNIEQIFDEEVEIPNIVEKEPSTVIFSARRTGRRKFVIKDEKLNSSSRKNNNSIFD